LEKGEDYVRGQNGFDGIPEFEKSSCVSKARYDYIFQKTV
jgi:lysophospholipase